jgi:hypothetical protein
LAQEIDEDDSMIKVGRRGGGQLPSTVSLLDFEAMLICCPAARRVRRRVDVDHTLIFSMIPNVVSDEVQSADGTGQEGTHQASWAPWRMLWKVSLPFAENLPFRECSFLRS